MDYLWSPWRYKYISKADQPQGCVFCLLQEGSDEANYIIYRGAHNYVVLNIFPYTSGHLLIVPFAHIALLSEISKEISDEMMDLTKEAQSALGQEYRPDGFNLGMNLGRAAGAGVAEHLHMHVLPRWIGDANFTTVVAETRILPEELETCHKRLKKYFNTQP
jgi:ATP adenylyltransferase